MSCKFSFSTEIWPCHWYNQTQALNQIGVETNHKKKKGFYKLLPANKTDHLCQLWQSCSDLHEMLGSSVTSGDSSIRNQIKPVVCDNVPAYCEPRSVEHKACPAKAIRLCCFNAETTSISLQIRTSVQKQISIKSSVIEFSTEGVSNFSALAQVVRAQLTV